MRHVTELPLPEVAPPEVPIEAFSGRRRRQHHNRRRTHDPFGQGQPCIWWTRLIKVAALVYESTRRVVVWPSSSWPYLGHDQQVGQLKFTALSDAIYHDHAPCIRIRNNDFAPYTTKHHSTFLS